MSSIAERLDALMRSRGIKSQNQLARVSGVPQSTINRILKKGDAYSPEWATLKKLATALNVSVEWLTEGVDSLTARQRYPALQDSGLVIPGMPSPPDGLLNDGRISEAVAILNRLDDSGRRKVLDVLRLIDRPTGDR